MLDTSLVRVGIYSCSWVRVVVVTFVVVVLLSSRKINRKNPNPNNTYIYHLLTLESIRDEIAKK